MSEAPTERELETRAEIENDFTIQHVLVEERMKAIMSPVVVKKESVDESEDELHKPQKVASLPHRRGELHHLYELERVA